MHGQLPLGDRTERELGALAEEHLLAEAAEPVGRDRALADSAGLLEDGNGDFHGYSLIRMSTPAGMLSFERASTVLGVGSLM